MRCCWEFVINRKLTWATTYATFGVLLLRSLCEIPVVRGPFDLLSWALMSTIKTGHSLYVPRCSISRRTMLAPLKLKPEVVISELIAECERDRSPDNILIPGCWICEAFCVTAVLEESGILSPQNTSDGSVGAVPWRGLTEIMDAWSSSHQAFNLVLCFCQQQLPC